MSSPGVSVFAKDDDRSSSTEYSSLSSSLASLESGEWTDRQKKVETVVSGNEKSRLVEVDGVTK